MSELKALRWYFDTAENMAIYQLDFSALRKLGLKNLELDRCVELVKLVDKDATKIINEVDVVYRNKKCKKYISTRSIPKRKHCDRWEFQYKVLPQKADPKNYKDEAYVGTSIELNSNFKPALLLWISCKDIDVLTKIVKEEDKHDSSEAIEIWGHKEGKNIFIIGEVVLSSKGGHFKSVDIIVDEYSDLIDKKLLKGKMYSLIAKLAKVAKKR